MTMKAWALGLALAFASATGAMACSFSANKMTTAEIPRSPATVEAAEAPVDLWLLPYLA